MTTFTLKVYAAERVFYEGPCESVVISTTEGMYGILAHHRNMIAAIESGLMEYRLPGEKTSYASVSRGVLKVEDNEVLILVDTAERPEEIDENRAKREAEDAKEAMLQKRSYQEYRSAEARLGRAMGRLKAAKRRNVVN